MHCGEEWKNKRVSSFWFALNKLHSLLLPECLPPPIPHNRQFALVTNCNFWFISTFPSSLTRCYLRHRSLLSIQLIKLPIRRNYRFRRASCEINSESFPKAKNLPSSNSQGMHLTSEINFGDVLLNRWGRQIHVLIRPKMHFVHSSIKKGSWATISYDAV